MRPTRAGTIAALFLASCALASCGGDEVEKPTQAELCIDPTPTTDVSQLGRLPLDKWGTITKVQTKTGFVGAEAISDLLIVELYPQIVRDLDAADYVYLGGENEGFEAELAFSDPKRNFVSFALRETDCKSQIRIRVLVEIPSKSGGSRND